VAIVPKDCIHNVASPVGNQEWTSCWGRSWYEQVMLEHWVTTHDLIARSL